MTEYQYNYSRINKTVLDVESRIMKYGKMYGVLNNFSKKTREDISDMVCLDVGCSSGIITANLSKHFKDVIGVDIDYDAVHSTHTIEKKSVLFLAGDALKLPIKDLSIDVVICNHVYEHVPDRHRLMEEIYRVLRDDGFCYLAAGNKYAIMEPHYRLPFLSWLPKGIANLYLRVTGRGTGYYENFLSYWALCRLLGDFRIEDYTPRIARNPIRYNATDVINEDSILHKILLKIPDPVLKVILRFFSPTYIFILTKR